MWENKRSWLPMWVMVSSGHTGDQGRVNPAQRHLAIFIWCSNINVNVQYFLFCKFWINLKYLARSRWALHYPVPPEERFKDDFSWAFECIPMTIRSTTKWRLLAKITNVYLAVSITTHRPPLIYFGDWRWECGFICSVSGSGQCSMWACV